MYQAFYRFALLPFENTPDPRFFFASEQHREALAGIEYTIRMRKGFALITGDIGSGKTTVGRMMCERCGDRAMMIQILHGHPDGPSLIRQVLAALGEEVSRDDDWAWVLERLRVQVSQQMELNRPVVLFIDEAQTLSDEALETVRLMSNFDTATQKPIQAVLVGQPELRSRLRSPRHQALRQRIVMARQLRPLLLEETRDYVLYRLKEASEQPEKLGVEFTPGALREIHRVTGGIPRLINMMCDNCLLLGYVQGVRQVTPGMVHRVYEDMVPSFADEMVIGGQQQTKLSLVGSV